ncbi:hypothetical protein [Microbacterium sp. ZXX196]|uniref:hypothetical protein n=1 Tax=Microbacterium sp. ZXX196 TaxID=2609291 RepID=UPI0012B8CB41|nr:hypothetical protein [Microbacterium sp. ZXX196]MTE24865.1 hypothetical protein [Microbacterium sp. ZXX196]
MTDYDSAAETVIARATDLRAELQALHIAAGVIGMRLQDEHAASLIQRVATTADTAGKFMAAVTDLVNAQAVRPGAPDGGAS